VPERLRHLLGIEPLSAPQIATFLEQSRPFQEIQRNPLKKLATLRGKSVALAFFEPSTRTRISFATAAARLGADTMQLQAESSSLRKGESLLDTVYTLEAMKPDCLVMRHSASGAPHFVSERLPVPVVNAGDGTHEHPTQALLDALTILDRRGRLDGWQVAILGDILHSRVARSNLHLLSKFGCRFRLCGPPQWVPRELEQLVPGVERVPRIEQALDEYFLLDQLTPARLRRARPDAIVLHPGPMIRGLEIDPAVADGPQSCVREQVTNGLAVRMNLLYQLIGGAPETAEPSGTEPAGTKSTGASAPGAKSKDASHAAD
jgi:aspartate carbamoyltransferase catalytic subunit